MTPTDLKPIPASLRVQTVPDLLRAAAATFEERNAVYGSNYLNVGPVLRALFPDGIPKDLPLQTEWHLFELIIVKLTRFANSNLTHLDSIHDSVVYGAMVESILKGKK